MEKSNLIPVRSIDVTFSKFDKNSFYVHQTVFDYRLKLSTETYELLMLANGTNTLEDIKNIIDDIDVTIDFLYTFLIYKFTFCISLTVIGL